LLSFIDSKWEKDTKIVEELLEKSKGKVEENIKEGKVGRYVQSKLHACIKMSQSNP
jgi:hypothetical protein